MTNLTLSEAEAQDLVERLRSSAKAFRENPIYSQDGDLVYLTVQADEIDQAANIIATLPPQDSSGAWDRLERARLLAANTIGVKGSIRAAYLEGKLDDSDHVRIALAALGSQDRPAPDGWVLVPREPTPEMWEAAWEASVDYFVGDDVTKEGFRKGLAAMLAAAPSAPSSAVDEGHE